MRRPTLALAALMLIAAPLAATAASHADHAGHGIAAALGAPTRTPDNKARDASRRPAETLAFVGLQPGMTVVEIWPGGGYFTEILAPAVGPSGKLIAATYPESERTKAGIERFRAKMAGNPGFAKVAIASMGPQGFTGVPAGSVDMVLTFRNVHNWMGNGFAPEAFRAFHTALKPGGVLGIEEHRLPESRTQDPKAESGYVKQSEVIKMAEAAGFRLVGSSEINANPRDTADYPKGVWTLPPNFAEGDKDRAKYAAIGESDRMLLKFVK